MNARDRALVQALNARRDRDSADDKCLTKELLERAGVRTPRTHFVLESLLELAAKGPILDALDDFVVKPARGGAGGGIVVLIGREGAGWRSAGGAVWTKPMLRRQFGNILFGEYARRLSDKVIVEERLRPASILTRRPTGLADVRVITVQCHPVLAMVRVPTRQSGGRANLHQGAIGVGVDLDTGHTTHATHRGRAIENHPDTGERVVGVEIPGWDGILETAVWSAAAMPLGYLGIDVALTEDGEPVVLEVNARPGLEIQNANHRGLREAIREVRARHLCARHVAGEPPPLTPATFAR